MTRDFFTLLKNKILKYRQSATKLEASLCFDFLPWRISHPLCHPGNSLERYSNWLHWFLGPPACSKAVSKSPIKCLFTHRLCNAEASEVPQVYFVATPRCYVRTFAALTFGGESFPFVLKSRGSLIKVGHPCTGCLTLCAAIVERRKHDVTGMVVGRRWGKASLGSDKQFYFKFNLYPCTWPCRDEPGVVL